MLITALSVPAILGFNLLSGFQPLGEGSTIMDLEDFLVSSNLLPLGDLVFVMFCVRKNGWGFENFIKEANTARGIKFPKGTFIRIYMQYILPIIVTVIYLKGYYDTFSSRPKPLLAFWMCFAALAADYCFRRFDFCRKRKKRKRQTEFGKQIFSAQAENSQYRDKAMITN